MIKKLEEQLEKLGKSRDKVIKEIEKEKKNILVQTLKNIDGRITELKSSNMEPKCVIMSHQLEDYLTRHQFFMPCPMYMSLGMPKLYKYKGLKAMTNIQLEPDEFYIGV